MLSRVMGADFTPELGHYVLVPDCMLLPGVGKIVGFEGTRPVVQSVAFPNVTVAVKRQRLVLPERCRDEEHPDCLVSEELAIDCAQFTRHRLGAAAPDR